LELRLAHRKIRNDRLSWLSDHAAVSEVITLRAMVSRESNNSRALVELKAPNNAYPLYGKLELNGGGDYRPALEKENRQ